MKVLEAISNIAGKYFAFWVICIAAIAYFIPAPFLGLTELHNDFTWGCYVWDGINVKGC